MLETNSALFFTLSSSLLMREPTLRQFYLVRYAK
jgi:hypothetical protein